jgi:hypothetical protein
MLAIAATAIDMDRSMTGLPCGDAPGTSRTSLRRFAIAVHSARGPTFFPRRSAMSTLSSEGDPGFWLGKRRVTQLQKSDKDPFRTAPSSTRSMQRGSSFAGEFTRVLTG